jgi:hypothetical protein
MVLKRKYWELLEILLYPELILKYSPKISYRRCNIRYLSIEFVHTI